MLKSGVYAVFEYETMSLMTLKIKKLRKYSTNTILFDSEGLLASINRLFFHFLKKADLVIPTAFFKKIL